MYSYVVIMVFWKSHSLIEFLRSIPNSHNWFHDTTFKLEDFYVSVLSFRHTLFIECPVISAAFLIHERKFRECREKFLMNVLRLRVTLQI